jgi:AcrR family transcriptional regulator
MAEDLPPQPGPPQRHAGRADEILDCCRSAFAEKGFAGTSMQDLARAAGMSAGNFYRYFPSKEAIIVALVDRKMQALVDRFAAIISAPAPRDAFMAMLAGYLAAAPGSEDGALWIEAEAAATRIPALHDSLSRMRETVLECQVRLFARIAGIPEETARQRFRPQAQLVLMLVRGAHACTRARNDAALQQERAALHALILRTIDTIMTDIATGR